MTTRPRGYAGAALVAAAAAILCLAPSTPAAAARPLLVGIQDDRLAQPGVPPGPRMALVAGLRAEAVRVDLRWDLVALRRPERPRLADDPAYDWSHYDAVVAAARARRVRVIFTVWGTPGWAADPSVPASATFPSWSIRPRRPEDIGDFAAAAAARYAPRGVRLWEAGNEPNIPLFLRPQYRRSGGRWVADSPRVYARMLRAMYRGIKGVDPRATVAGGVTAPVGVPDPQGCPEQPDCRITPRAFVRALNAPGRRPPMDAYAHHPYPLRAPSDRNFAGASYTDLYNLSFLRADIDRTYLRGRPLWLTEFGIATRRVPQYPFVRTPAQQRSGLLDALRRVRADRRVRVFVWYLLQDHRDWASGLLTEAGRPKPAAAVFRREARR